MLRVCLSLLVALGMAVAASAQTPPPASSAPQPSTASANPYSATVPVAGTSDAQRNSAIAAALAQVLQQVSPGFVASPDMLANASGYVRDFHYQRAASGTGLELQVDFDPGAVGRLVAQGSAPAAQGVASAASSGVPATGTSEAAAAVNGTGTLWVDGIDNSDAFASLLAMLRGDQQLHDVMPVGADDGGVLLQVGFSAPLATVLEELETPTGHLAQDAQPHPGADASLRWVP